ncbi:MAG: DUF1565 domain-containing protein [Verrucomicrobiota bacterium]|nr:DUF1565 domain-containing protein [Limisphaera sp.]MDW8380817.1 DUF1565 domain-containing protein [Verrucomicrobiota bacterium]
MPLLLLLWSATVPFLLQGAVFFVRPDGNDANAGTEAAPWRTIQHAVSQAQPGDTIRVLNGVYRERVTTVRGGTSETNRILLEAVGTVVMRGWVINHPYITVRGFDITEHTHPSNLEAYVRINTGGSYFHLLSCSIRDGRAVKRHDFVFRPPNRIETATGGLRATGFEPGQTILVMRGTNIALSNQAAYVIADVTDNAITVVENTIREDGPKPAYITGSPNYGVYFSGGTRGCILRGNRFRNLSYRYMFIQGFDHQIEGNIFEENNGWDLLFWTGTNHVVRSNLFRNLGWGVYEPSPDVFDNWPVRYENVHFVQNMVVNMIGVINAQKRNATVSGPLYIRGNVFVDTGWLSIVMPNTIIEHNTFLRVAKSANVAVQVERHPVIIRSEDYATNVVIRNNAFVDCGQATGQTRPEQVGWYRFTGPTDTALLEGNYVSGGPPDYHAKAGWPESEFLNGGDPGFVNIHDPLGPDGTPFTADDGLRLKPHSKLLGAGAGGATVGAYDLPFVERIVLEIVRLSEGQMRLGWPRSIWTWSLEVAAQPDGPWEEVPYPPVLTASGWEVVLPATESLRWFRLRR